MTRRGECGICGCIGKCRLLYGEYNWYGKKEVYAQLLVETFGSPLSNTDRIPEDQLICEKCVELLRDANSFRHQSEKNFLLTKKIIDGGVPIKTESTIKIKLEVIDSSAELCKDDVIKHNGDHKSKYPLMAQLTVEEEYEAFQNYVTIVRNSYVCPFGSKTNYFYCVYCKEMFTDAEKLRDHTLEHDAKSFTPDFKEKTILYVDILMIDCRLCSETIDDLETLKRHITSVHGKILNTNYWNGFLPFRLTNPPRCTECDKQFIFFNSLRKHMVEHFATSACDLCGLLCFNDRLLKYHKYRHAKNEKSESRRYKCSKCPETFSTETRKYRHMVGVHNMHRSYPCEQCAKVYDTRRSLWRHERTVHLSK